ncbi:hypothetical protein M422DRAFT_263131 [Sphaerobolus stellatus SS14]|uniref:Uncharacterized protein n=1 Tax=Sphaerobolus stellatus (strain SS14) TaxID=990650 RepID=A0A0C9VBA9_SPHS4|nr:hypothetical protein M422DRAFT_263131 [Sphaerobolus stellatus SS14]
MVLEEHTTGFEDFDTDLGNGNEIESEDDAETHPSSLDPVPCVPSMFIQIFHHPHSGKHAPTIINLDSSLTNSTSVSNSSQFAALYPGSRPWAPFRTRSDFEFIEEVVTECLQPKTTDKMLNGYHGHGAKNTSLTVRNHKDVTLSLAAARKFGIEFQDAKVSHEFQDPWDWILDTITDTTLSEKIMWFPVQKFLNDGYRIIRLYDDLNSGNLWWDIQSSSPREEGMPHCFLPLHLWLDKSNVSTTIKMHPIIIRPGFLPSAIRNGSGNSGGMLIGYMAIVGNPNESSEVEDDSARSVEIAQFKRENSFWCLSNSDPYVAYSYDILHALDSGEWGKHQWPLLLEILTPQERARLSKNMDRTPRWRGLKHFKMVSSADFTDGNSYKDILKV